MISPDLAADEGRADEWTRPTTPFWQQIDGASHWRGRMDPPYLHGVPIALTGGAVLELPVRRLPGQPGRAVASLIANQASFEVVDHLSAAMAALAGTWQPDVIVGLPTLGMVFAPPVAQLLGHRRWVPLGYSRKFWYDEALSAPVKSITTPGAGKRIYLDPHQLSLVLGRRVVIVDDVVSSGTTLCEVWNLFERLGIEVIGAVVAMRQGGAWREALGAHRAHRVQGVFDSPLLEWRADGWWPLAA
jgi:adenine/guanine phosphoribosyltransferase-like PRPP-binding protein